MKVRHAIPSDARAIAEIHVSTWRDAYRGQLPDALLNAYDVDQRAAFWNGILATKHGVFVVEIDTTLVGFCSMMASRDPDATPGATAEITALYVSSEHWRRGVARRLCTSVFEATAQAGFSDITLWVLSSNRSAIGFYEAAGFAPDGATKTEQASEHFSFEEIRMRRTLALQ